MGNCCMEPHVEIEFPAHQEEPKRFKTNPITEQIKYDNSLVEFPLDNGKKRIDYCPFRCGICLMGILKEDARCASCVSHVFHSQCLEQWEAHLISEKKKITCPICKVEGKSDWINTDEEFSKNMCT